MARRVLGCALFLFCTAFFHFAYSATANQSEQDFQQNIRQLEDYGISLIGIDNIFDNQELVFEWITFLKKHPSISPQANSYRLKVALSPEKTEFGLGKGSANLPEWSKDENIFYVYNYAETNERRASLKLEKLSPEEKRRLWRRRAIVNALIYKLDRKHNFSEEISWKKISGWDRKISHFLGMAELPRNSYEGSFSRLRGMDSARQDLVTFAEEFFVNEWHFQPKKVAVDDLVFCQEFSKLRFIKAKLEKLHKNIYQESLPECQAFQKWMSLETFSHFEVGYATPTPAGLESIFGHVFMRIVSKEKSHIATLSPGSERILEIAALIGPAEPPANYVTKGLAGGFNIVFSLGSLDSIAHRGLESEQRDLVFYPLNLKPAENLLLFEKLWELERKGYFPYFFFNGNCASYLLELISSVLDNSRGKININPLYVFPASALDELARVKTHGKSLLGERTLFLKSNKSKAQFALQKYLRLKKQLPHSLNGQNAKIFADILEILESENADIRSQGIQRLLAFYKNNVLAENQSKEINDKNVKDWSEFSLVILLLERYRLDVSVQAAKRVRLGLLTPNSTFSSLSTEFLLKRRQTLFEREDAEHRQQQFIDDFLAYHDILQSLPRRAPNNAELMIVNAVLNPTHFEQSDAKRSL